jgi:hypothetical protein
VSMSSDATAHRGSVPSLAESRGIADGVAFTPWVVADMGGSRVVGRTDPNETGRCHGLTEPPDTAAGRRCTTSRLIIDTVGPSRPAMTRSGSPQAIPQEISSRSCSHRCRTDRVRGAGRTPPASSNNRRIDDPFLPSRRAIDPGQLARHPSLSHLGDLHLCEPPRHATPPNETSQFSSRCCVHALKRQHIWRSPVGSVGH